MFWYLLCKKWNTWNYLRIKIKFIKIQKKRPVLVILSGLLSQLSDSGIASRYNKSEDALILTVAAKYSDFWKCLLVNAAVY